MSDNTTLNPGTGGDVISTDDIGGVKVQRVKVQIGTDGVAQDVHSGNPLPVTQPGATGSVSNNVASSNASVTLLAANASRKGATVYNDSTQTLYLILGTTASTTGYTVQVPPQGYLEVPFGYTGAIAGIWPVANGFAYVTELT